MFTVLMFMVKRLIQATFIRSLTINFCFVEVDSQGRLIETDKWDNHNAIARGWQTVEDNYHPVTFRRIYGVDKQQQQQQQHQQLIKTTASAPQLAPSSHPHHPDNDEEEEAVGRSQAVLDTDEADL